MRSETHQGPGTKVPGSRASGSPASLLKELGAGVHRTAGRKYYHIDFILVLTEQSQIASLRLMMYRLMVVIDI